MTFTATEATWSFVGSKIKLEYSSGRPSERLTFEEFTIDGDTLTLKMLDVNFTMAMWRVGASHRDAHPIIRDWSSMHHTGKSVVRRFGRNGNTQSLFVDPSGTLKRPYRIDNDMPHIRFEG